MLAGYGHRPWLEARGTAKPAIKNDVGSEESRAQEMNGGAKKSARAYLGAGTGCMSSESGAVAKVPLFAAEKSI